jgi:hypothetical protein
MQHRLRVTTAWVERMFHVDIVDASRHMRLEAVDRPPLAVTAPDPPIEPMPPTQPPPAPVPEEEPALSPPPPPPPTTAEIEAAAKRPHRLEADAFAAKKRAKGMPKRPAALKPPVLPAVATPPHDITRHCRAQVSPRSSEVG